VRAAADGKVKRRGGLTTRAKLIASTVELLQRGGYAEASVAAVTARSGVAAGTLYRHFASKEALFVEVFRDVCERELNAMANAAGQHESFAERLDAVVEVFARRALRNPRLAWALIAEPVDPLVDAERLAFRRRYRDLLAGLLDEGVADGSIPAQDTLLSAAALVGAIGDALVGPIAPAGGAHPAADAVVAGLVVFCRRAAGAAL